MIRIYDSADAQRVRDPTIRRLLQRRLRQLRNDGECGAGGSIEILVVEPGDSVAVLEEQSGCPILRSLFDDSCFGDLDFAPSFEVLEEHSACYEMGFILNDDGFGVVILIPKHPGIDRELLSLCRTYAAKSRKRRRS